MGVLFAEIMISIAVGYTMGIYRKRKEVNDVTNAIESWATKQTQAIIHACIETCVEDFKQEPPVVIGAMQGRLIKVGILIAGIGGRRVQNLSAEEKTNG